MITVENVSYAYPQAKTPALREVSLSVAKGEFVAIVGGNGAGKSTLSFLLSGFIPHHYQGVMRGMVQVAGMDIPSVTLGEIAGKIGLVFSNPFNQISGARFTVEEEVAFGLENLGVPREEMPGRIERVLEVTGLADLARRSPYALSGGQQQRLALASMLVMEPQVLILDEPTSQLDPAGKIEVFSVLNRLSDERAMTVVLIEHELEWIGDYADRVIVMNRGRIVNDGRPQEILADEALIDMGAGNTAYTEVARAALDEGLVNAGDPLPVTLDQAVEYFSKGEV